MIKNNSRALFFATMFVYFNLASSVFAASQKPGIADVLSDKGSSNIFLQASIVIITILAVFLIVGFVIKKQSKKLEMPNREPKIILRSPIVEEMKKSENSINHELNNIKVMEIQNEKENVRKENDVLKEEGRRLQERIKKYEESIKSFLAVESTLKKSNQLLQGKYEKILSEREGLILELNRHRSEFKPMRAVMPALFENQSSPKKKESVVKSTVRKPVKTKIKSRG